MIHVLSATVFVVLWMGLAGLALLIARTIRTLENDEGPWYRGL